jgi:hypothetical protein
MLRFIPDSASTAPCQVYLREISSSWQEPGSTSAYSDQALREDSVDESSLRREVAPEHGAHLSLAQHRHRLYAGWEAEAAECPGIDHEQRSQTGWCGSSDRVVREHYSYPLSGRHLLNLPGYSRTLDGYASRAKSKA